MKKKSSKKKAAVLCALAVVLLAGSYVAGLICLLASVGAGEALPWIFVSLYGLGGGAVIVGVLLALKQRLKEIEGAEEEEAKKY